MSRRLAREGLVKLEQRTMPGVGIRQQHCIRQMLTESVGVRDRNHLVVNAVDDKRGLVDLRQIREAQAGDVLPVAERGDLRGRDLGS